MASHSPDTCWAALGDINYSRLEDTYDLFLLAAARFGQALFNSWKPSPQDIFPPLYQLTIDDEAHVDNLCNLVDTWHYPLCGWRLVVSRLIGCGLDKLESSQISLFQAYFGAYTSTSACAVVHPLLQDFIRYPSRGVHALCKWLETLRESGINLEQYGKAQAQLYKSVGDLFFKLYVHIEDTFDWDEASSVRLIAMEFGPNPEDWKLWLSDPTDQFAGEFWDMIESPERSMPGAWDEFSW
ncbi:hypothetical protein F5884DRAFT_11225 [Xylogone sp. PMI_703]|nr:hypothetical protein F5884DRAFT_11225 [Xylogone sp. PMI_703]